MRIGRKSFWKSLLSGEGAAKHRRNIGHGAWNTSADDMILFGIVNLILSIKIHGEKFNPVYYNGLIPINI